MAMLPPIKAELSPAAASLLQKCRDGIDLYDEVVDLLTRAITDEPGFSVPQGRNHQGRL